MLEESFYGKPREVQLVALRRIEEAIKQGYHNIIISAPTGTGKSFIATALALYFKEGDILTATINLQKQYLRDFPFLKSIMGRKNFRCRKYGEKSCSKVPVICCKGIKKGEDDNYEEGEEEDDDEEEKRKIKKEKEEEIEGRCEYYPHKLLVPEVLNKGTSGEKVIISDYSSNGGNGNSNSSNDDDVNGSEMICDYYRQKIIGLYSSFRVFNYHEYFTILLRDMKNKDRLSKVLLVCDEAHMLEDMVVGFFTLEIDKRLVEPVGMDIQEMIEEGTNEERESIDYWIPYVRRLTDAYSSLVKNLKEEYSWLNNMKHKEMMKTITDEDELKNMIRRLDKIRKELAKYEETYNRLKTVYEAVCSNKDNFIVEIKTNSNNNSSSSSNNNGNNNSNNSSSRKGDREYKVKIIPLNTGYFLKSVFDRVQYRIFMSATINYPLLMKVTGLDKEDTTFIELPSTFPVENRRILLLNRYSLNRDSMQDAGVMKRVAEEVESIMNKHTNERGLILTTSYYLAEQIYSNCISKRNRLLLAKGLSMEEIMEKHLSTSNSVIITPSMWEGVDLKDDLCRFIIIVKTPYPDLSDKRTAVLATKDREWYELHTISRLIQGSGRGVRHDKDYCITYVLDSNVSWLLKRRKYKDKDIPVWFREAIVWDGSSNNNDSNGSNRHIATTTVTTSRLEDLFR